MLLYEPIDNRKLKISFSLANLSKSTNRLQTGITDNFATLSLAKLIGGGIKSMDELNAAEQCLRSLIFHETVVRQSPCVTINNMFSPELELEKSPIFLSDYLGKDIIKHHIGNINNLRGFVNESQAELEIARRKKKEKQDNELNRKIGCEPVLSLAFDHCPLERVAHDINDYTESCFATNRVLQSRYILPLAESNLPTYISYPFLVNNFENTVLNTEKVYQAKEFFGSIDAVWKTYNDRLRNRIEMPIPMFLSIVLGRARNREDIGRVILELREEYRNARKELWAIFEQLDDVKISDQNYIQILTDVETTTKEILQSSLLPSSTSNLMLSLDNQKRFWAMITAGLSIYSGGFVGVVATISAALSALSVGNTFNMSAARLSSLHVKELNQKGLLTKFLSAQELNDLQRSLNNYI